MAIFTVTVTVEADDGYAAGDLANGVRAWLGRLEEEDGIEVVGVVADEGK